MKRSNAGAALVVAILLIGILGVCLLGFLLVANGSRKRAVSDKDHAKVRLIADLAAQEAMGKIVSGFAEALDDSNETRGSVTASPGLMEIRFFDRPPNRGTEKGATAFQRNVSRPPFFRHPFAEAYSGRPANPQWIPLFSWKYFAPALPNLKIVKGKASDPNPDFNPAVVFDINTTQNPFHPGHHYLTGIPSSTVARPFLPNGAGVFRPGESAADRPIYVQWLPVQTDPNEPASDTNPLVGRYAYWVDVENTKVNLLTSTRPLRQSSFFAALAGEPDAIAGGGSSEWAQSDNNPYRLIQKVEERGLPRRANVTGTFMADGEAGQGTNSSARLRRDFLLGWHNGGKPFVADNSIVDWDYFNGLRPAANRRGESVSFDDLIGQLARSAESNPDLAFNSWDEVFSLLDPAIQKVDPAHARLLRDSLRRVLAPSTTIHGYEDERDPLGQPKIDFLKFQLDARKYAGAGGSPAGFKGTELWRRLSDPKYHRAYSPAAYTSGGAAQSFVDSFNRFAGNGNAADGANGEIAVQQLLLNLAEATLPDTVPPHIDPNTGLVGMRSIPYVAEVATRARSAIWLLPEEIRNDLGKLLTPGFKHDGKDASFYLTHVIIDLAIGCVNPDPFSRREFQGTLRLDYSWHNPPAESVLVNGPLTAPLLGRYTALPLPGDKPGKIRVDGEAVYFHLGVIPGEALANNDFAQTLRIRGWEIRDNNGALWHSVPIRHPRAASSPQWWQMAEAGANAGAESDQWSLEAFQPVSGSDPHRAIGWFAPLGTEENGILDAISMHPTEVGDAKKLGQFLNEAAKAALVERVFSRDPALGHRTGNRTLTGVKGRDSSHQKGHFYGMLGHTWRRIPRTIKPDPAPEEEVEPEPDDGDGDNEKLSLRLSIGRIGSNSQTVRQLRAKVPRGVTYIDGTVTADSGSQTAADVTTVVAEIWKQKADSLTAFFSDPKWETCPLWEIDGARCGDEVKEELVDTDVETPVIPTSISGVKTKEFRQRIRSFFAGAPRGDLMTSIGEIGFCHSGFPNFPVILTDAFGWNEWQLNCARNGPPMRMLLDLFTPGAFTDAATRRPVSEQAWRDGNYTSNSPERPRRGTWNLNTTIAHDAYLAIREGGDPDNAELKQEFDPVNLAVRVAWVPSAAGYRRTEGGAEYYRGKKLEDLAKKRVIGLPLDRYSGPSPVMNRASNAWVGLLGGDFTLGRVSGGTRWGFNNAGALFFGPPQFTWNPGIGAAPAGSTTPFADFSGTGESRALLLTFGSDGRKEGGGDGKATNEGFLRGRFAADQCLTAAQANHAVSLPLAMAPRFGLVPMRHYVSELATEYNFGAAFGDFKTALNPRQSAFPPSGDLKQSDGAAFPGAHHASGVFANAPVALLANQVSTSANVFTIHVVAQTLKDSGQIRAGVRNSGLGHSDPDDLVLAERWAKIVVMKLPPKENDDHTPRFRILQQETRNSGD